MHRRFIALIVSFTIVITGASATSASADSEDIAKVIAGLAALALIGKAINDRNDRRQTAHRSTLAPEPYLAPRPLPSRVARKSLPAQCVRQAETDRGPRRVLGASCLDRTYRYSSSLPQDCARRVWTQRGWRWAYGARCLRRQGYEIARN